MDFLKISSTKLKIMLDDGEMKKYGLDKAELDYSDPELRAHFWQILDEASTKCGFKTRGEKILIQFYPAKSGGEIFITKLGPLSKSAERSLSSSERVAMLSSEIKLYRFDDIQSISSAIHIAKESISDDAKVYFADNGSFYLMTEERGGSGAHNALSEFSEEIPLEMAEYIKERSRKVEEPIATFEKLYNSAKNKRC